MFKCIKEASSSDGLVFFLEGKIYSSLFNNEYSIQEAVDETGDPHIIGKKGEEWFDEHFRELTDEEFIEHLDDTCKDMSEDQVKAAELLEIAFKQQVKKQVDPYKAFYDYFKNLYGQGLEIANWHQNGDLEPFDEFFMSAEYEMNNNED